ncbi:putative exonuclease GOR [Aphidius gifuensis]|uniref:putative exonuclease GOR n=1 Tax=Aphidius gifuensis TaxID=684658 RepID=UPI001CDC283F|nr:putative exonuclease GOR [Aphidius gifuensis]
MPRIIMKSGVCKNTESEIFRTTRIKCKKNQGSRIASLIYKRSNSVKSNDAILIFHLRKYILNGIDLVNFGYPVESTYYPGCAIIVSKEQHRPHSRVNNQNNNNYEKNSQKRSLNVNAGSGSTSSSVVNSDIDQESSSDSDKFLGSIQSSSSSLSHWLGDSCENLRSSPITWNNIDQTQTVDHYCVRCFKNFLINRETNVYITKDKCIYHWGKLRNYHNSSDSKWNCCDGDENSSGCTEGNMHVWTGITQGFNGPFDGYLRTKPSRVISWDDNYGVYALDCEMCFTKNGLEVVKVSVVDIKKNIVYDTLVKPDSEIIDYNTRFSGITESMLKNTKKTLKDVQKDLLSFISAETILIGHGLENDLKALKILHSMVIDTCVVFPHFLGYPFRSSLKTIAKKVLKKQIQLSKHDSIEDAKIVVDLLLARVEHDKTISLHITFNRFQ